MAGDVRVNGTPVQKAGMMVNESSEIILVDSPVFVGRGGLKLDHALDRFGIDVTGKVAADIGASTGGFTDCLLKRGTERVYAIDVGYGQLDYRLRKDNRVVVMERVNARYPIELPEKVDIIVIDVSFISLEKILPPVSNMLNDRGDIIVLVKPQFEAKRGEVAKGGVIRNPAVHSKVLARFIAWLISNGFRLKGLITSPVKGASGNKEFLVRLKLA